ncbi:DoxX family protein [Pontixanthobacter aestiaquae]|uniref:DoxX family membrane protein n=1 Tax=Pontixanthobacter aestiaquae TaxID=1509367 RepID=A0A844Z6N8_9SPHN|nr:DoxX family protein [Pontixanthobacter aestiaquae]MDN3646489.1 DoxX family protein [Pontixanthobacter aestiaquae]MXO82523.1 DoxX family membrane protein [Pontixanthobacter aestiaquae]
MRRITTIYDRATGFLSGRFFESLALLLTRLALAGVFWRSYKTKVVEGTWFQIGETQYYLFEEFGLPLSPDIMVPVTTYAEFAIPILVGLGIFTRFSAAALMGMALVIQLLVFPTSAHFFGWAITIIALAMILISRGAGIFSFDALVTKVRSAAKD